MNNKRRPLLERFWSKVDKSASDGCWLWTGCLQWNGYGQIGSGGNYGRPLLCHRLSYELANGPLPESARLHHKCGVRNCVNPAHLFVQNNDLEVRFWANVDKRGNSECWLWTGLRSTRGYGSIRYNGKMCIASRICYEIHHGPIPSGLCVCHTCDNPPCVNPSHLFLGTSADNAADRDAKGRHNPARGSAHGGAKLTWHDVDYIRRARETLRQLARKFGISISQVWRIRSGAAWSHNGEYALPFIERPK